MIRAAVIVLPLLLADMRRDTQPVPMQPRGHVPYYPGFWTELLGGIGHVA